jgi:UPF0271 protein
MGEVPAHIVDGTQEALMASVTSVNIACGGHAGDAASMETTIRQALRHGVAVGAHPGYPDRENFGRFELDMPPQAIADSVYTQVALFGHIAERCGAKVVHVKAHGALYNQAVKNAVLCRAIADGVRRWRRDVVLVGLAGSAMLDYFREAGFAVAAEAFADRAYEADGTLRSRKLAGALIEDPEMAAEQAVRIVEEGKAQTICVHGDTPGAVRIAGRVAGKLRESGVELGAVTS